MHAGEGGHSYLERKLPMVIELSPKQQELLRSIILGTIRAASRSDDRILLTELNELLAKLQ